MDAQILCYGFFFRKKGTPSPQIWKTFLANKKLEICWLSGFIFVRLTLDYAYMWSETERRKQSDSSIAEVLVDLVY